MLVNSPQPSGFRLHVSSPSLPQRHDQLVHPSAAASPRPDRRKARPGRRPHCASGSSRWGWWKSGMLFAQGVPGGTSIRKAGMAVPAIIPPLKYRRPPPHGALKSSNPAPCGAAQTFSGVTQGSRDPTQAARRPTHRSRGSTPSLRRPARRRIRRLQRSAGPRHAAVRRSARPWGHAALDSSNPSVRFAFPPACRSFPQSKCGFPLASP